MNPVLASIYGTGLAKTASEATTNGPDGDLDLNSISAADFLALLEQEQEPEKTAGEGDLDLSQMTAAELLELAEQADQLEELESEKVAFEQMVQDGSFAYADRMGRIMAHAFAEEGEKLASAGPDEIEVDLDNISGEQLMELIEQGYDLVDDSEKVAGVASRVGGAIADRIGFLRGARGKAEAGAAKKMRRQAFKKLRKKNPDMPASEAKDWADGTSYRAQARAARMAGGKFNRRVGQGAIGGTAVASLGTAGGAAALLRKKKKKDD